MPLACPSCGRTIAIQDAKPGRFRVPCPECGRPFLLRVGDGPEPSMTARAIEPDAPAPAPSAPFHFDARGLASRVVAAMAERAGWAWRALSRRKDVVGGALILQELGRTSRGTVARGRQVLLGRDVLVRLLPADWGGPDPVARARADRLAHVAGEVVHPNLVRRLDFGDERGRRYAIEEALEGPTLAGLAARDGWPGGKAAIVPVLHAARGLLAAHEQGLAHGDPSAEQVWLDAGGVVKLAGIGLWSPPGTDTRDGAEPFPRSVARDVQVLGTALEALSAPRQGEARGIATRMKASGTPEGFRDLAEAIRAMEGVLQVPASSGVEAEGLADVVARYHDAPLAPLRAKLVLGFLGACAAFAALFASARNLPMAAGVVGLCGMTSAIYALVRAGMGRRALVFGRARELVLGGRRADWLTLLAAGAGAVVVLFALGWLAGWIALAVAATLFAVGFAVAIDVPIDRDREGTLAEARELLASMRGRGVAETTVRRAVREHGGRRWAELSEALFGEDESGRAPDARRRPALDWLDARLRDRREARDRARFEAIEEAALVASRVNEMTARRKSRRIAEALLVVAREVRAASLARLAPDGSPGAIRVMPRPVPDLIREAVETPDAVLTSAGVEDRRLDRGPNPLVRLVAALTGPRARFLVGGLLVAAFLLWAEQVGVISSAEIRDQAGRAIAERDVARLRDVTVNLDPIPVADEPLRLPGVPEAFTRPVSGYGVGAAGLILIASAFVAGSRVAAFAAPGAAVAWFGPALGVPPIGPLPAPAVASAAGAGLLVVGTMFAGRR